VTDALLVRAPVGVVYRTLTDLDGWTRWLDGCRSERAAPAAPVAPAPSSDHHRLVLPGGRSPLGLSVTSHGWRHDAGMHWDVTWSGRHPGGVVAEWWLEERREGVVVRHLVHETRGDERSLQRYRTATMTAMQALKDHLELAVAHAARRVP
jgi:hypothetical protein